MLLDHNFSFDLDLQETERGYAHKTLYKNFAAKLSEYEWYADIPIIDGKIIKSYSMCGLQSLAMGLKVIGWDFTVTNTLPDYHKPENVVQELEKFYK